MTPRAVVFDLWQTLVRFREPMWREFYARWSESIGTPVERLTERWYAADVYERRETGPIRNAIATLYEELGCDADVEEVVGWRIELHRRALRPDTGVVETLEELQRRGLSVGLISNCTEEVSVVWGETQLAPLIDVAVFSATARLMKPDRRIYELACTQLDVDPSECLFVGDGANDELRGAERIGMTPVLVHPDGAPFVWDGLDSWDGLRIAAIPHVLDLLE